MHSLLSHLESRIRGLKYSNCFKYVQLINVLISVAVFFPINVNVAQVFEQQKPVASALISFTSTGKEAWKAFLSGAALTSSGWQTTYQEKINALSSCLKLNFTECISL